MSERELIARMLSRRRFLEASGLAAAGGLVLAACGGDGDSGGDGSAAAPSAGDVPTTTITNPTLGFNNPNSVIRAPIFVGQTKGFFKEVGIESIEVNAADEYMPALVSGSFDISLADSDVLFGFNDAEAEGESLGIRMIGINQGSQPLIMIANEGITVDNLAGKKVGGARAGSVNEAISKFILSELGLDWENDVEFTTLTGGSNDWVTAMLSGQIDATVAFPRHIGLATAEGGSALFQESLDAPQAGFAITQATADKDPGFAAAWNYAWIQAQEFCKVQSNKQEVIDILQDEWGEEVIPTLQDVYDVASEMLTADNGFDPAKMDEWMDFIGPFNDVADDVNDRWRNYFDLSGLHAAQEALGLPLNPAADLSSGTTTTANL